METDSAITDPIEPRGSGAGRGRRHFLGRVLWLVNLAALVALALWVMLDPKFGLAAHAQKGQMHALAGYEVSPSTAQLGPRVTLLWCLLAVALASTLGIFIALFVGARSHRGLRSWLAFTLLVAAWLTLLVGWREFAWQGKRLRLRTTIDDFDAIAKSLRDDWPKADGEREGLGSFMAYPQGQPRMLMMLMSETDPQISAIERADDGSLGFEIRDEEEGTWLEWHPAASTPRTFVSGLESEYDLGRASPLGRGWYLVRYR